MFSKEKNPNRTTQIDTLIGEHTHVKGDISFSGGLRVDGSVAGNIIAAGDNDSVLTLSEQGSVEGEIRVPNVILNGSISGNVHSTEHIELAPKAKIQGNVYYNLLQMAMGSEVNGQLIHTRDENADILDLEHEIVDDKDTFHLEQKD